MMEAGEAALIESGRLEREPSGGCLHGLVAEIYCAMRAAANGKSE
jgi:hypothetical protein